MPNCQRGWKGGLTRAQEGRTLLVSSHSPVTQGTSPFGRLGVGIAISTVPYPTSSYVEVLGT